MNYEMRLEIMKVRECISRDLEQNRSDDYRKGT